MEGVVGVISSSLSMAMGAATRKTDAERQYNLVKSTCVRKESSILGMFRDYLRQARARNG